VPPPVALALDARPAWPPATRAASARPRATRSRATGTAPAGAARTTGTAPARSAGTAEPAGTARRTTGTALITEPAGAAEPARPVVARAAEAARVGGERITSARPARDAVSDGTQRPAQLLAHRAERPAELPGSRADLIAVAAPPGLVTLPGAPAAGVPAVTAPVVVACIAIARTAVAATGVPIARSTACVRSTASRSTASRSAGWNPVKVASVAGIAPEAVVAPADLRWLRPTGRAGPLAPLLAMATAGPALGWVAALRPGIPAWLVGVRPPQLTVPLTLLLGIASAVAVAATALPRATGVVSSPPPSGPVRPVTVAAAHTSSLWL
jgi:hypothetical protein